MAHLEPTSSSATYPNSTQLRRLVAFGVCLMGTTILLGMAGCTFENTLNDRRCSNNSACTTRFGDDWMCVRQYCQQIGAPMCATDADCQEADGFFCNGLETCDPADENADVFGCLPGDPQALIDDGVACTIDLCDESLPASRKVINDASGCPCQGDAICSALNDDPCVTPRCDEGTWTCDFSDVKADDTPCDDGIACTTGTVCMTGACVLPANATLDDSVCQDGSFCNGDELCAPDNASANPVTGCVAGTPPSSLPAFDDSIGCTIAACVEGATANTGSITQDPRGCQCRDPEDCRAMAGTCQQFRCDPSNGFVCEPIIDAYVDAGSTCNDGASCTTSDACTAQGTCEGTPVQLYCTTLLTCDTGTATCDPFDIATDAETGCICK